MNEEPKLQWMDVPNVDLNKDMPLKAFLSEISCNRHIVRRIQKQPLHN